MLKKWLALALLLCGTGLVVVALVGRKTDEERIIEQLVLLEQLLGYEAPPNILQRTATLNGGFGELLTETARLHVPERGLHAQGKPDIVRLAAQGTLGMNRFLVQFDDIGVELTGPNARVTTRIDLEAQVGSEPRRDERGATLHFVLSDGEWLIDAATVHSDAE